ncbi:Centrosomal protein, partial [Aphis craccivora]
MLLSLRNYIRNIRSDETFGSTFSDELTNGNLGTNTLSEMSSNKKNVQMESMYSSFGGQSSLGILELDNMSDIGHTYKRESFQYTIHNNQSALQHRLSQASQARNTLARASSIKNIVNKNEVNEENARTSLTNVTNAFNDMLKNDFINSSSSFSSDDFICGSDFKEKLAETEEINRKEFGSLSESRFDFSLEGEKQSNENASFAANYFAAKSIPVEDLSAIFPKRKNCNETFKKEFIGNDCSFLVPSNVNNNPEDQKAHIGYKTMSSITSWTDSHVSNNLLNLTSLSDISEVLTSKTNSANPKELTEVLLSGDLSDDRQLNEFYKFPQRRLSTSTRFSYASQNLEHAELCFQSLDSFSFISPPKNTTNIHETTLELKKNIDLETNYENKNEKSEICINSTDMCTSNKHDLSNNFIKKQTKTQINNGCNFFLTSKDGYYEDCTLGTTTILENNIDLSNFSILTNNNEVLNEMSFNKSTNISKIVYCNEAIRQDKLNQSNIQDYRKISKKLEIGDVCIGTYSQAVITLENRLTVEAKYTLHLLDMSLNHINNSKFVDNKPIGSNVATVFCSDKTCIIPPLSEASFTIGIIPLISGSINIYIKLKSNDITQEIYRNIQIHSIEPQVTWINNSFGSIDFGLLPELSQKSIPIKLLNKGAYQVPIKFILSQDNCDVIQGKAILNPSELWQCYVNIRTTHFSKSNCKLTGRLQVVLDSVEELSINYSPLLFCSNLTGCVGFTSISFDQNPLLLQKTGQFSLNGTIEITNNSELPISLVVQQKNKQCAEFTIQPDKFKLGVNEKVKLKIVFFPSKSIISFNETSICLQVVSSQKQFFFKVNYIESNFEFQQISSPSSRPISPWSTSSSSAVGRLELESTCSSLIWGSVPSNTKSVQIFTLRNRGSHKEKLHLRIKDNKNCFKLISSGENQVSEMKLLLEPMESQKLSVALISTSNEGQAYGHLVLQRQRSDEKRVISLYGYCGHSVIVIRGPFEDNFGNMWLYPNPQLMTSQLSITNSGNTAAFVKIIQVLAITIKINVLDNSSEDIIHPHEFILRKGETTNVEITIVMSPERLEMLLGQNCSSKVININKISVIYGDEASRMRISRLWKKNNDKKKIVYLNQQRLDEISNMFNDVNLVDVSRLVDTE